MLTRAQDFVTLITGIIALLVMIGKILNRANQILDSMESHTDDIERLRADMRRVKERLGLSPYYEDYQEPHRGQARYRHARGKRGRQ